MKNWLRRKIRNFLSDDEGCLKASSGPDGPLAVSHDEFGGSKNLNLNIYYATGGVVIKSYKYDHKTDRSHNSLYIIREEQDLANELSRIITVESLK